MLCVRVCTRVYSDDVRSVMSHAGRSFVEVVYGLLSCLACVHVLLIQLFCCAQVSVPLLPGASTTGTAVLRTSGEGGMRSVFTHAYTHTHNVSASCANSLLPIPSPLIVPLLFSCYVLFALSRQQAVGSAAACPQDRAGCCLFLRAVSWLHAI